ncbi:MAG TPA: LOG family protein [Anaerohalosphaeraceae bacterium]|nr:LOG family protein [Anaerohalosphaeraceae bacterium]
MTGRPYTIVLFGAGKAEESSSLFQLAEQLGRLLAETGYTIANGGYGGTMLASARGAASVGGSVIGVTCRAFGRSGPNPYITQEISTADLSERLAKLIELGQAYLVLPGGTGTLLELADVWERKNKGFANTDKPIILIGEFWKTLADSIAEIDPRAGRCIHIAADPQQVLNILSETLI